DLAHRRVDSRSVGDVEARDGARATRALDLGESLGRGRLVAAIIDHDEGARASQRDADGAPDPAATPGHERDTTVQIEHDRSPPRMSALERHPLPRAAEPRRRWTLARLRPSRPCPR